MTDVVASIVAGSDRALLVRCLESLIADRRRSSSLEIVVLDNASTDWRVAEVTNRFPDVRVISQRYRAGFGANQNTIIRATHSRYIYILNDDTETPNGTIDELVTYLETHPRCAVVGPRVIGPDGRQQGSAWRLMSIPVQLTWALTLGQRGAVVSTGDRAKVVGAVSACAMLVRRDAFERIGLFDERYFMFSEEADIARRLALVGYQIHYVPSVTIIHHGQQTTATAPDRQINEHWRSFRLYTGRWHSPGEARVLEWLTGIGYALAFAAAHVAARLPARLRPSAAGTWKPSIYARHARQAFREQVGDGIREAADDFNRQRDVGHEPGVAREGRSTLEAASCNRDHEALAARGTRCTDSLAQSAGESRETRWAG